MSTPLKEMLESLTIKLENVIPLVGSVSCLSRDLEDLIDNGWDDEILVEAGFTQAQLEDIRETNDMEYAAHIITGLPTMGILVRAHTPVPIGRVRMEGGQPMGVYSWGHCSTKWFHVATLEDLTDVLPEWRKEVWLKDAEVEGGEG